MQNKPFAVLGVNTNGYKPEKLKQVMEKEDLPWRSFADARQADATESRSSGPIATSWNLQGTPTLFIIDHKGVIRHRWLGSPGEAAIDRALEKLIPEAQNN